MRHWDETGEVSEAEQMRNSYTDAVVSNSRAAAELAIAIEKLPRELVTVIPHGISANPMRAEPDGVVIGSVGNSRPVKGHSFLFNAFRQVRQEVPQARLIVAGRNDAEPVMSAAQMEGVTLTGEIADPNPTYRQLTLYVHSSLSESLPMVILEAMSHGLPVVATDVGGTKEAVIHGETGLIVPPANAEALAQAILELLRDPPRRRRMGMAGQLRARAEYSLDLLVSRHEQLFRRLLSGV
jgi:glycosyltransferase involved in cell wall biosynthesis